MRKKIPLYIFKERLEEAHGDKYEYISGYTMISERVNILHKECGETYTPIARQLINSAHLCPCLDKTNQKDTDKYNKEIGDEYELIGEYTSIDTDIVLKHNICNKTYITKPRYFNRGQGRCPYCNNKAKSKKLEE